MEWFEAGQKSSLEQLELLDRTQNKQTTKPLNPNYLNRDQQVTKQRRTTWGAEGLQFSFSGEHLLILGAEAKTLGQGQGMLL